MITGAWHLQSCCNFFVGSLGLGCVDEINQLRGES